MSELLTADDVRNDPLFLSRVIRVVEDSSVNDGKLIVEQYVTPEFIVQVYQNSHNNHASTISVESVLTGAFMTMTHVGVGSCVIGGLMERSSTPGMSMIMPPDVVKVVAQFMTGKDIR